MKNIKNSLFFAFLALSIASCNDAIEVVQDGEIYREDAFKTVADLRSYINGDIYNRVNITNEIAFTTVFTDEVGVGPDNGGQGLQLHRFQLNANDGNASGLWSGHYTLINRVNRLIEFSDLVIPTNLADTINKNLVLAEARTLRAHSYLQLVSFFSENPSDPNALGVILSDRVYDPLVNEPRLRVSNQEIYDFIEEDLLFAENNLNPAASSHYFVTTNLVNAIRARMYVYRKDYVKARQYASAALSARPLVTARTQYIQMWGDSTPGEVIFAASRPSGGTWGNIASTWFFNVTSASGGCFHDMGRNLFNLYEQFPNDVRRTWIDATAMVNPDYLTDINYIENDVLPINKYPGKTAQPLRNDLKIYRSSEMLLILAECDANDGLINGAANTVASRIRQLRAARGVSNALPVYSNAQAAWADIMLERRKELAFEGHRYIDIKRLATLAGSTGLDRNPTDDNILNLPLSLDLSDHRWTLPIPQAEISGNVTIQQNTGY